MKTLARLLAVACLTLFLPSAAAAQWWGAMLDRMHELSGPKMRYLGLSARVGYQPGQRMPRMVARDLARYEAFDSIARADPIFDADFVSRVAQGLGCVQVMLGESAESTTYREDRVDRYRANLSPILKNYRRASDRFLLATDPGERRGAAELMTALPCEAADLQSRTRQTLGAPVAWDGLIFRLGVYAGTDLKNDDEQAKIHGYMIRTSAEYLHTFLIGSHRVGLGLEAGVERHRFHGDIKSFSMWSYPLLMAAHPFAGNPCWVIRNLRLAGGLNFVPAIKNGAFDPRTDVAYENEVIPTLFVGWDISFKAAPFAR